MDKKNILFTGIIVLFLLACEPLDETNKNVFVAYDNGRIFFYDNTDRAWAEMSTPTDIAYSEFSAAWGIDGYTIVAFMYDKIYCHNGKNWSEMKIVNENEFYRVNTFWGTSIDNIYAGTDYNGILHYDGVSWSESENTSGFHFINGIWGTEDGYVFAVGGGNEGKIYFKSPQGIWSEMPGVPAHHGAFDIWGTSINDIFIVNSESKILHYDGSSWITMSHPETDWLMDVWGTSSTDVYAVGGYSNDGLILHYNGLSWTEMTNPSEGHISFLWGNGADDIYAVSYSNIYHYDGNMWSLLTILDGTNSVGLWGN